MWAAPGDTCGLKALWTDAPDASDQLRQRVAAGLLSPSEHADFVHFIDHGWLVWRNAIAPDLVDAFVDDIHSLHRHPDRFVMTDLRGSTGKPRHYGTVPNRFESIYDLYVNLPSARAVSIRASFAFCCKHSRHGLSRCSNCCSNAATATAFIKTPRL